MTSRKRPILKSFKFYFNSISQKEVLSISECCNQDQRLKAFFHFSMETLHPRSCRWLPVCFWSSSTFSFSLQRRTRTLGVGLDTRPNQSCKHSADYFLETKLWALSDWWDALSGCLRFFSKSVSDWEDFLSSSSSSSQTHTHTQTHVSLCLHYVAVKWKLTQSVCEMRQRWQICAEYWTLSHLHLSASLPHDIISLCMTVTSRLSSQLK